MRFNVCLTVGVRDVQHDATQWEGVMAKYKGIIQKVTSGELLTKQAIKKNYYIKNMYILKLLLDVVTARIGTLVIGNKFLYSCVK
jgi:hypothetical protein